MSPKPIRYFSHNPYEEIPASYHTSLGNREAYDYALANARQRRGQVVVQYSDESYAVLKDFRPESERAPNKT